MKELTLSKKIKADIERVLELDKPLIGVVFGYFPARRAAQLNPSRPCATNDPSQSPPADGGFGCLRTDLVFRQVASR